VTHALLGFFSLLLGTALVLAGVTRATRAAGVRGRLDLLVAVPVLGAAQIIATLVFAGAILGQLNVAGVLVTNAVVSGALLVFVPIAPRERRPRPSLVGFAREHPVVAALAVLAALAFAWRIVLALVLPPYGYDALNYHLPTVIGWIQSHRISTSPLNICCAYYPQNGELLTTWPAVLGGGIEYVDLVQVAAALVGAAAVAGIARVARLPQAGVVAAASLFLLTPVLLEQANTSDVDVTFTATAVAAYFLIIRALEAAGRRRWLLFGTAGVAAGLCLGVKPTGSAFFATLALPLIVGALARRRWPWRETRLAAALFTAPVAVFGLSWYIRSWLAKGSPYYPMDVKVAGVTVFHGTNHLTGAPPSLDRYPVSIQPLVSWASDLDFWTKRGYTLGGLESGGLGPVWSYFGAVLSVVFAVYAWRRCRPVFWFFVVPTALLFLIQPDHWYSRYTIGCAALGAIAVAWAMTTAWRPAWARVALGVATLVLAGGAGWVATRLVRPTTGFNDLSLQTVLSDVVHGRRTVGTVFNPDYRWIDLIHGRPVALDPHSVHMFSPMAGRRFENLIVPLPHRTDLRAWLATHDVAYIAVFKDGYYDDQARADPTLFEFVGGDRIRGYRVKALKLGQIANGR
jgi:hypothetical protein